MEYNNIVESNIIFYNFIQRTEDFLDLCIEHEVAIINTLFDNGFSTYIIKNKHSIVQKMVIMDGLINEKPTISTTFKIMNTMDQDLQSNFSVNGYSSYISLSKFENYIEWFSTLTMQCKLLEEGD